MRLQSLILVALVATACDRPEQPDAIELFKVKPGQVERISGCHVTLDDDFGPNARYATVRFACGVPESARTQEHWWGEGPKPQVYALDEGDCILLDKDFFCIEQISRGKTVSFRKTFMTEDDKTIMKRLPRTR